MDANEAVLTHATLSEQWLREELEAESEATSPLADLVLRDPRTGMEQLSALGLFLRDHRTARATVGPDLETARAAFAKTVYDFASWFHDVEARTGVVEQATTETVADLETLAAFFESAGPTPLTYAAMLRMAEPQRTGDMYANAYGLKKYRRKGKWQRAARSAGLAKVAADRLNTEATALYDGVTESLTSFLEATSAALVPPLVAEFEVLEQRYADLKRSVALLDFDDLLHHARDLLAQRPDVRAGLASRYTHVLEGESARRVSLCRMDH